MSGCTPWSKENITEPKDTDQGAIGNDPKDQGDAVGDRYATRSPLVVWSSKGANFIVLAHCNGANDPNRSGHFS